MTKRILIAAVAVLVMGTAGVWAQDGPGSGPPPGAPRHGHGQQGDRGPGGGEHGGGMGGPMGLLPPGTWWRDAKVVAAIGLTADQQKHIDDTFLQSRAQLIDLHASLEKAELMMEPLLAANPVDQGKTLAQISKIADTRAELEKANAKMLLSIRGLLSAEQWTKLQGLHKGPPMGGHGDGKGQGRGQGGPGGGQMQHGPGGPPAAE